MIKLIHYNFLWGKLDFYAVISQAAHETFKWCIDSSDLSFNEMYTYNPEVGIATDALSSG